MAGIINKKMEMAQTAVSLHNTHMETIDHPFDAETWAQLPTFFEKLTEPVQMVMLGDPSATPAEYEAARLCRALAARFDTLTFELRPRRADYPFYPLLSFMAQKDGNWQDVGVRIVGVPNGYQMTSLVAAIQAVSFRGMTLEATTRLKLYNLATNVHIEVFTAADDQSGAVVAHTAFSMAANHRHVWATLVMADAFPQAVVQYSIYSVPHVTINGRIHIQGVVDEETLLQHIVKAVKG